MRVRFKYFASSLRSWDSLFDEAAEFATKVGPDRLISISHSHGGPDIGGTGVITVWYWADADEGESDQK